MTGEALALDAFMARLTPAEAAAILETGPVDFLDQISAAISEVELAADSLLAADSFTQHAARTWSEVPEWLRLSVLDTVLKFAAGEATTCMHDPRMGQPEPVIAAAWRPGLVICRNCPHLFLVTGDADRTCDRCGYVSSSEGVYPCQVRFGPLVYLYGLCVDCLADQSNTTS